MCDEIHGPRTPEEIKEEKHGPFTKEYLLEEAIRKWQILLHIFSMPNSTRASIHFLGAFHKFLDDYGIRADFESEVILPGTVLIDHKTVTIIEKDPEPDDVGRVFSNDPRDI